MNRTYKVSILWLNNLLICLDEGSTELPEGIYNLNLANQASIEKLVYEFMLPFYLEASISNQFYIKESLRYGLNFWSEDKFSICFDSLSLIVQMPDTMTFRSFLLEIWKLMFAGEDYITTDTSKYEEVFLI